MNERIKLHMERQWRDGDTVLIRNNGDGTYNLSNWHQIDIDAMMLMRDAIDMVVQSLVNEGHYTTPAGRSLE